MTNLFDRLEKKTQGNTSFRMIKNTTTNMIISTTLTITAATAMI